MSDEANDDISDFTGIEEHDDGSVTLSLTSEADESPEFFANLASFLPTASLDDIATDLLDKIEKDKEARKQRDKQYEEGIRRTGLGHDAPGGAEFEGASRVVHPVMAESCVDFASSSARELLPPSGPVLTQIIGKETPEKIQKAQRKRDFMNWQLTRQSPEFRNELEQLLTQLPLGGSQYMKIWWDLQQKRLRFEFTPIDNVFIPFAASSLYSASRYTIQNDLTEYEFQSRVRTGLYAPASLPMPGDEPTPSKSEKANRKVEGKAPSGENEDGIRRTYEVYTFLELQDDPLYTDRPLPYIVTIDEETSDVLAIYRNWDEADAQAAPLEWLVEFNFIPWRGAYGVGLPHLIGGLAASLTGALRALLDSAHIQNAPTLLKLKGARSSGQSDSIDVTQVFEIDASPGVDDIRKIAMPLPFNGPSGTLFQLLGYLDGAARGVISTSEEKLADATNNGPVGTTLALIEQGSKIFSAIHARLHESMRRVLQVAHRLDQQYLDDEQVIAELGEQIVYRKDFEGPTDICPVSDPNIFSETQRAAQNQLLIQLAQINGSLFDQRAIFKRILEQNKVPNIKEVMPDPAHPDPMDPVSENVTMAMGKPAMAYPNQDHEAHITVLLHFMRDPLLGASPIVAPKFLPLALEHLKQHMIFYYARKMGETVSHAAGNVPITQFDSDNPGTQALLAQAFATAVPIVEQAAKQANLQTTLGPVIQMADAMMKKMQQPPPMDPSQAAIQTVQMQEQTKQAAIQAKTQTAAQQLQLDAKAKADAIQVQIQKLELEKQKLMQDVSVAAQDTLNEAADRQTEVYKNDQDNRTALDITAMRIAADMHENALGRDDVARGNWENGNGETNPSPGSMT